ncbi:MAG: MarR family transcriptional regulator [Desulfotomaculaceae bacterium]|nr:MarR family transcriptional regulator [Desulfotomaculaceae bacterium]MDD4766121.1 MarR family transcriptional regulator [Desulfotomaculaceae bacterium]
MRDKFFRPLEQKTRSHLSHVQHFAVSTLYRKGSLSMSELAQEMQISKQQLTPIVNKLVHQSLLVKKADEYDRRIVRIEVTEQGRNMLREIFAEMRIELMDKLRLLSDEELAELDHMLKRVMVILRNL